jgi:hypothetical protein
LSVATNFVLVIEEGGILEPTDRAGGLQARTRAPPKVGGK